jgi:integrase
MKDITRVLSIDGGAIRGIIPAIFLAYIEKKTGKPIAQPVFCTRDGQFSTKSNLTRQVFRPILKAANATAMKRATERISARALLPEIRFHELRHTHATIVLARGNSVKAVSQRLGHASIDMTLRYYAHVLPEDDNALANDVQRMFG